MASINVHFPSFWTTVKSVEFTVIVAAYARGAAQELSAATVNRSRSDRTRLTYHLKSSRTDGTRIQRRPRQIPAAVVLRNPRSKSSFRAAHFIYPHRVPVTVATGIIVRPA